MAVRANNVRTDLVLPSWQQGFARNAAESEYPGLWRGKLGHWVPALGPTGLVLRDVSGRQDNGAFSGVIASDWKMHELGYAVNFDGDADYILCGKDTPAPNLSVSCWGRTDESPLGATQWLMGKRSIARTWAFGLANDEITFYLHALAAYTTSGVNLVRYVWHFYAATVQGTALTIYLDGKVVLSTTMANTVVADAAKELYLGDDGLVDANRGWNGMASEWRMYNRALTSQEVRLLYTIPYADLIPRRRVYKAAAAAPPAAARRKMAVY